MPSPKPQAPGPILSILLPAHNERENLPVLLAEIDAALGKAPARFLPAEIIVVDDRSTDATGAWLDEWAVAAPETRIAIHHEMNRGQSAALKTGFEKVRGEFCLTLDGDGQNDPADIPKLLALIDGADVVTGIRAKRRDNFGKRIASRIGNGARNWLLSERIRDSACGFKVFRASLLKELPWFDGAHRLMPALFALQRARIVEIEVNHRPRGGGASHYGNLSRGIAGLKLIRKVRKLQRESRRKSAD
jgi:dolichol-phosphate mannosyltransferase